MLSSRSARTLTVALVGALLMLPVGAAPGFAESDPTPPTPSTSGARSPADSASPSSDSGSASDSGSPSPAATASTPVPASPTAPATAPSSPTQSVPSAPESSASAAKQTLRVGAAVPAAIPAPTSWGFTVVQPASNTPGTTWSGYGNLTISGKVVPAPPPNTVVLVTRNQVALNKAVVAADGTFRMSAPHPSSVGSYVYQARLDTTTFTSPTVTRVLKAPSISIVAPEKADSVKAPPIALQVTPAIRSKVRLQMSVKTWTSGAWATTNATGRMLIPLAYAQGLIGRVQVRGQLLTPALATSQSPVKDVNRIALLDAVVRPTTSADVRYTYHTGCPVGPKSLSTITMNYIGYDKRVHSGGVIIVRSTVAAKVVAAFADGMKGGFPIKMLVNPNYWKASDVAMMNAGNTSAFNCRHVTGNPYAMSPHSYGTALDINTWENPYEDPSGRWYGNTKYAYYRPASVPGLLVASSPLTKALRSRGAVWLTPFDWQHFQW